MAMVDWQRVRAKVIFIFIDQFLLISYAIACLIALTWPTPGKAVASVQVRAWGRRGEGAFVMQVQRHVL